MIALDTNILLYAHREEMPFHQKAFEVLKELSESPHPWAIPWPCLSEFVRVSTHSQVFSPPSSLDLVIESLKSLLASPSLLLLSETERHEDIFLNALKQHQIRGNLVFDTKIYALCKEHGISELITADGDFLRFKDLKVHNPFS